ncbi:MAG: hypothetical protein WCQ64_17125 [Acidobacteriota bacterium]
MNSTGDNCPAGRSCSTAGAAVPGYLLLGAGIGAVIGWMFVK